MNTGHICLLHWGDERLIENGEGFTASASMKNAAAMALLKLFPDQYPHTLQSFSWKLR